MDANNIKTRGNYRHVINITIIFLLISISCLIINYSVGKSIDWSLYPIGGLIVIMAGLFPLLMLKKYKVFGLFAGLTVTIIPYIYLIQILVSVKDWFFPLALPILILSLVAFGISLISFTSKKLNKYAAAAITLFLFGVIVNFGVDVIVNRFLNGNNDSQIVRVLTISGSVILSLILMIIANTGKNDIYKR